ncbi:hypothetical protein [Vibrio sp. 10N.261.55.A7]|uniref:hypothetical protein n=1 Tax=Vibrio sp. 10N.261.55.A7 TaxID=1880851 RepID=UPI000C81510D|nr:hypothetical protein [Vibrio sp. 10N.261.55.A7]PMJ92861.1 hypothetical protein BCU12_06885 [Vibrio sp. 10N.261.55.A7]
MIAAIKWIKWGSLALVLLALAVLWMKLETSDAKRETAEHKLASALTANLVSQTTIETLTTDNEAMNRLLVNRERQSQQAKKVLQDEIEQLQQQMENIECDIPIDVTERLRQPY